MEYGKTVFETERLILKQLTLEEIEQFESRKIDIYDNNEFSIYLKLNNQKIGMIGFSYVDNKKVELRYGIATIYRNNGYMTEILKSFIKYLFDNDIDDIIVIVKISNLPSNRVVNKLGFKLVKRFDYNEFGVCNYYIMKK